MSLDALTHVWDIVGLEPEEKLLLIYVANNIGGLGYSYCPEWVGMGQFISAGYEHAHRVTCQLADKGFIRWGNEADETNHLIWIAYDGPDYPPIYEGETKVRSRRVLALLDRDGPGCRYCDAIPASYHVDHFVPKCLGGPDKLHNLVLSCGPCNMKKSGQHPDAFLANDPELLRLLRSNSEAYKE